MRSSQGRCQCDYICCLLCNWEWLNPTVLSSSTREGSTDPNSPDGSGSSTSCNRCARNFMHTSAQNEIATVPQVGSVDHDSLSGVQAVISVHRNWFRARSMKLSGTNFESINMYMLGAFVHAKPTGEQHTQFVRAFKFWWVLISPRWLRTSERGAARGWQRTINYYIACVYFWPDPVFFVF